MPATVDSMNVRHARSRIASWWRRWRDNLELSTLPPDESDRILTDIGISMADMKDLTRPNSGPATLLPHRLELLGIDAAEIQRDEGATYRDLEVTCSRCASWRRCARDLSAGDTTPGQAAYCLNAHLIERIAAASGDNK